MKYRAALNPGRIAWTGDNHCLQLEAGPGGPWTALSAVFRVRHSEFGPGQGVFCLAAPDAAEPHEANFCLCDNPALFRWLCRAMLGHYAAFKARPALASMVYGMLERNEVEQNGPARYVESFTGLSQHLVLEWCDLQEPVFLELPPEKTSTKRHEIFGTYVTARRAVARLNGTPLPGETFPKAFLDATSTSAYLIFSETWIDP